MVQSWNKNCDPQNRKKKAMTCPLKEKLPDAKTQGKP